METLFKTIIKDAIILKATDIHFIPVKEDRVKVQLRISGENTIYDCDINNALYNRLLIYMKFIAHLDVSERNKAQSGQYIFDDIYKYYLRISTLPLSLGIESCSIRLTPKYFEEYIDHNIDDNYKIIKEEMFNSEGLFLFTGPTGSGKSTIMYQFLYDLQQIKDKHIITIEDPVEQVLDGVVQVSVNEKANINYHNSFKAILRCDPDVVMLGEIRDEETAKQVIQASLSGHLILSTMHAKDNLGAIYRLLELGISKEQIKQGIACIANQRLLNDQLGNRYRQMTYIFSHEINLYLENKS